MNRTGQYILKKAARLLVVLLGVSLITFGMTVCIEGDPAELALARAGIDPTPEEILKMQQQMGLDKSLAQRYVSWMGGVLHGDLGVSNISGNPVTKELCSRLPATLQLTGAAFGFMLLLAVPLGIVTAVYRGRLVDHLVRGITFVLMATPGFVLGFFLCYRLSAKLKWLPMVGNQTPLHLVLPVLTLALPLAARYTNLIRSNLVEVLDEDYIFLLRSKGLSERIILWGSALKNAFIPVVSLLGLSLGSLLGGSVVVETLFSWPGLGSYLMSSIASRDYPVILGYVLLMGAVFVGIHYLVDLLVCCMDPRVRLGEAKA